MEYDKTQQLFLNYAEKCKNKIYNTFFTKKDLGNLEYSDELGINELIRGHRLKMINIKLEHTMRMVEQIIKINEILGLKFDFSLVIKVAILYHDVGRLRQATWSNTYNDNIYKQMNMPFNNHGEEGYDILLNNDFDIDRQYLPVISQAVLHHQNLHTIPELQYHFQKDLKGININDIVTGNFNLTEAEWQVTSLIVQLVADIDKADILYQHLSDDFNMIRDYIIDSSYDTLDNISKKWDVPKQEIIKYNKIDEDIYEPRRIKIPIANMPIDKLDPPDYMKEMFYNNTWPELNLLKQDKNWNFITILWWRLSHFLNSINFNSVLINIEESKLLEQIYEKVPKRLRPVVDEAFEYAKETLVEGRIKDNNHGIYL